ncbi:MULTISPECIES: alkaline phosphatase D family protein [unclassified Brevundimonas]|uniref:alkaline phosphatase D family protein n=1 Tax=unclassified Brevundimonas TaxID=2622653 RepID=UPI0025BC82E9|nr:MULTISPECIES: alkaline phosphatase D family protein [unclassified Brevundimonas]
MTMNRRGLLGLFGAGAAIGATPAMAEAASASFAHGVASGDPGTDRVILWTRVTPAEGSSGPISVAWRVLEGEATVVSGRFDTGPERDYTVKIDVAGLRPGRDYRYDFAVGEIRSPVGRTRTLAAEGETSVNLAVVSCQLYPGGLFNVYEAIAALPSLDAVVHLGDYIYEYGAEADAYGMATGAALNRLPEPRHEIVTLADYRTRHAQYKTDADLQAAHARAPFICVWDDHETANDAWLHGAENHQPETEGDFAVRKAAALKAYYEWMPIREAAPGALKEAIHRSFHFGDLASLMMVETRLTGRTEPLDYSKDLTAKDGPDGEPVLDLDAFRARLNDPARDLMGPDQREWLTRELKASKAAGRPWQVLGNQVVTARVAGPDVSRTMTPAQIEGLMAQVPEAFREQFEQALFLFKMGLPFNLDAWDGYPAGRERLYAAFADAGVQPIVLAGDSHAFWVNELKDAGGVRRAVEFGTSAVSSPSIGDAIGGFPLGAALMQTNDEVAFCDQSAKGFVLLSLTKDRADATLMAVSTIFAKPFEVSPLKRFSVRPDGGLVDETGSSPASQSTT